MTDSDDHPAITVPSSVLGTQSLLQTVVAQTAPVLASTPQQAPSPGRKHATLHVIYAESDRNAVRDTLAYIKFRYPKVKPVRVRSWAALIQELRQYHTIEYLILVTHSGPGQLIINSERKDGDEVAALLKPLNISVPQRIVFEGCSLLAEPMEAWKIAKAVQAREAVGYTWWHWMGRRIWNLTGQTPGATYRDTIDLWYSENRSFLVPESRSKSVAQPKTTDGLFATKKYVTSRTTSGRTVTLGLEWFRQGIGLSTKVPDRLIEGDVDRTELKVKLISSENEAEKFLDEDPTATPMLVTVRIPYPYPFPPIDPELKGAPLPGR